MFHWHSIALTFAFLLVGCNLDEGEYLSGNWVLDKPKTLEWVQNKSPYSESRKDTLVEFYNMETSPADLTRMSFRGRRVEVYLPGVALPVKWQIEKINENTLVVGDSKIILLSEEAFRVDTVLGDGSIQVEFWRPYSG